MEQTNLKRKDLLKYFVLAFKLDEKKVNWGFQMKLLNSLLTKYSLEEIKYAIDYYAKKRQCIYSLGWFLYGNNMQKPISLFQAEMHILTEGSGERNRQRMELNRKTQCGTDAPEYLFTGTE